MRIPNSINLDIRERSFKCIYYSTLCSYSPALSASFSTGLLHHWAMTPTSRAAARVPSRTPWIPSSQISEATHARATSETSTATFVMSKRVLNALQIASTSPSPARVTTPATTSKLTPIPTRTMPTRHHTTCIR